MLGYYLDLAWRSLRRSPGLTALMVLSIGVGVALAMSTWTLQHLLARDPIPQKSGVIYFPTIDMWGPAASKQYKNNDPPVLLDYATAEALLREHRATYQSANYWIVPTVVPDQVGLHPFNASGFAVTGEFFPMLDVPFQYGSGWSDADDKDRAQVVVIGRLLNDKVFGGGDSVGKTLQLNGRNYQVVGVLKDWNPQPAYYDVPAFGGFMIKPTEVFVPFNTAIAAQIPSNGTAQGGCFKRPEQPGFEGFMHSSCAWISYIAQLDGAAAVRRYREYLTGFAQQRFAWPPNVRLFGLLDWLKYEQVVWSGIQILRMVGVGLLIVCLVDTIGLMLAKFLRRSGEIGVRRALGAPRRSIYAQFLTEGALIGVGGGVLGIVFTWLALFWLRARFPQSWSSMMPSLDVKLLALTLVVAIVATLLAALYPTWRAAHVQPAWQIKSN
ncbi:MAG: ABC transporter, ATP-binding protein [Rhodanobacteraceae bacterium]|jgi:putative ABC transport system permease protein|nr:MAG: ABC transporter, ATP-binding protein [Rhodanobacteraceae bacterium]